MTNAPTTSPELLKSIDVVYERMNNVKNQKNELFELLNNMDEFSKIL